MSMGSVLIADDEEAFRESTSRLLRREGFECLCADDVDQAVEMLQHKRFDVMVSDIRMPHNPDLRIVKEARGLDSHLPIILVTAYPSVDTAIQSIAMAVDGYLTKPLNMEELFATLRKLVQQSRDRRRLTAVAERLRSVLTGLEAEQSVPGSPKELIHEGPLGTIRTLASCLSDLLTLWSNPATACGQLDLCELLDCPQRPIHRQAILYAIEVLEKTKESFKSKQLAELRVKLQRTLGIK